MSLLPIPDNLVDGHAYCYPRRMQQAHYVSFPVQRDALFLDFAQQLQANQLAGALLVQPSILGGNHQYLLSALRHAALQYPKMFFRGVACLPLNVHIKTLREMKLGGIIGTRLNLVNNFAPDFRGSEWKHFVQILDALGWFLQLQIEGNRLKDVFDAIVDSVPHLVIEHFALPDAESGVESESIQTLIHAKRYQKEKLSVSLSGPYRIYPNLDPDEAARACIALAQTLADSLGGERYLIWGSDWPFGHLVHEISYSHALTWGQVWLNSDGKKGMRRLFRILNEFA